MSYYVTLGVPFLVGVIILVGFLYIDAKLWKSRFEPEDARARRDRIDTELDDLAKLEEWRAALERQHEAAHIRIPKKKKEL